MKIWKWEHLRDRLVQIDRERQQIVEQWAKLRARCNHPRLPVRELGEEYVDTCPDCGHVERWNRRVL